MGFLKVIRTWALRDKMPIREIARRTGISRNTIKKYLREGIVEPAVVLLWVLSQISKQVEKRLTLDIDRFCRKFF